MVRPQVGLQRLRTDRNFRRKRRTTVGGALPGPFIPFLLIPSHQPTTHRVGGDGSIEYNTSWNPRPIVFYGTNFSFSHSSVRPGSIAQSS